MGEPAAFRPHWPAGLKEREFYEVKCDDKGRNGGSWLSVMVAADGDVHVSMHDITNKTDAELVRDWNDCHRVTGTSSNAEEIRRAVHRQAEIENEQTRRMVKKMKERR